MTNSRNFWLFLSAWLAVAVATSAQPAGGDLTDAQVLTRSVHFRPIGGSSSDVAVERIGWGIPTAGWEPFIKREGELVHRTGCRGLWLHNPWGDAGVWPMRWDQRCLLLERIKTEADPAVKARLKRIEETFVPAVRGYLRGDHTPGRKPHLWAYLGTASKNPSMDAVRNQPADWTWRWRQACYPLLVLAQEFPGQVSIGMDRTIDTPASHPHYVGALLLESLGMEVAGEPRPQLAQPHWARFGFVQILREGGWDRTDPGRFADAARINVPNAEIKGTRYGIINKPADDKDLSACRKALSLGFTPVMRLDLVEAAD